MKRYEGSPAVVIERRKGTPDSPFSNMNETLVVTGDGKVLLSEIPNELNRVIVTSEDDVTWYEITEGQIPENGFKVDYINKLVTFDTIHVGKQLHFKYLGEGNHYYSVHSIYTKLEDESVVETLGDIVEGGKDALDALEALNEKLEEVTQATNNAVAATTEANNTVLEGNQVIDVANNKITEIDTKITEATSKISELDLELDDARNIISDVKQQSTIVEDIITDGQNTIENANLVINEIKSVGEFNLTTFYKKNNTVLDNGSTWIALQDTQNNPLPTLPATENSNWRLASLHGAKGEKGDTGAALSILGKLTDVSQLPPSGHSGDAYTINGELYVWSDNANAWENVGNIKGEKGDKGTIGDEGKSAYEVAIINGFVGTELEWLSTLKGEKGDTPDLSDINDQISEIQQIIEQGGYENIDPLEATNLPADYPLGESFFANTSPNIASWQTALGVDTTFTRLFVITRIDKDRLHALQDILIASGTETKRFTRYNLNENWLVARESGGVSAPPYGVERINDNHAIRRFPVVNEWASDVNFEYFDIILPNISLSGEIRVRMVSTTGAAETIVQFERPTVGTAVGISSLITTTISSGFAKVFRTPLGITASAASNWQIQMNILKREKKAPLYVEVELLTTLGNAGDVLDATIARIGSQGGTPYNSLIQVGALEKAANAVTITTTNITFYVNPVVGNDDTGVVNDITKKFKTIQACIDKIPNVLNGSATVILDPGAYIGNVNILGFSGGGSISIRSVNGDFAGSPNYQTDSFNIRGCTVQVSLLGIQLGTSANTPGVNAARCSHLLIQNCRCSTNTASYAINIDTSLAYINGSDISNRSNVLMANNMSTVVIANMTGTGNTVGLYASYGSTIVKIGTQATASTAESIAVGGIIRS